ncbi:MAG: hypothetical protein HY648_00635 [Acidobacteria bacterium]|nr:hypothetical protein [Acidobacteriota bacterium]
MPNVLLLTEDEKEACSLQEVLGDYARLVHARGLLELESRLEEGPCDVLICAWSFYAGFWNGALQEIRQRYPDLPVVILSRTGGEREWVEVLRTGAFDLLAFPWREPTVLAVIEQAVVSHKGRKLHRVAAVQ